MYYFKGKDLVAIALIVYLLIEWFGLEGTLKITQLQPPAVGRDISQKPRLPKAPASLALSTARDGASTASLSSLFQCLTTL